MICVTPGNSRMPGILYGLVLFGKAILRENPSESATQGCQFHASQHVLGANQFTAERICRAQRPGFIHWRTAGGEKGEWHGIAVSWDAQRLISKLEACLLLAGSMLKSHQKSEIHWTLFPNPPSKPVFRTLDPWTSPKLRRHREIMSSSGPWHIAAEVRQLHLSQRSATG